MPPASIQAQHSPASNACTRIETVSAVRLLDWFPLISHCAARNPPPSSLIHGGGTARAETTDLIFAKANEDIEAPLELLGEVGGESYLRLYLGKFGARLQSYR